jgi:hypothetical protein
MPTIVLQFFYSKEELAQHGDEFYESHVHRQVEEGNHDKNFAIILFALESLRLVSVRGVEEIALKHQSPQTGVRSPFASATPAPRQF